MKRWARRTLVATALVFGLPIAGHFVIKRATRLEPPSGETPRFVARETDGIRRTPKGWSTIRGVRLVRLEGSPEEIGAQHTALLHDRMEADEQVLWDGFTSLVPIAPVRAAFFDFGQVRYRDVVDNFPDARRREIAAEAAAFTTDPYAGHLPTYQRMIMLHALYDIALGFEHTPLLGCTAFGLGKDATSDGHALFARAFDFEAADVFDRDKAVFLVHEDGRIPFASVAWPGFIGVVTGMNAEGVALAVHGGRAREPSTKGVPVALSLREVLASAHSTAEAVAMLSAQPVMVSHLVFVGDANGAFAVVERAPGVPAHVRSTFADPSKATVTNHFEGPLAGDPKDTRVRETTTTLPRRKRIDELLAEIPPKSATVERTLAVLRDHGCSGEACPIGDRRAIDALIATHGVIADLSTQTLWVSMGPHLSGGFVKIDRSALVQGLVPAEAIETLPEDPVLHDGRYTEGRARAGGPLLGGSR